MPPPGMQGAAQLTPEERRAYSLGRRSFERGDVESALAQLTQLLETRPRFADVHYMVGLLHESRGNLTAASRSLEQALRINPGYTEARLALAAVYEQQGDFGRSQQLAADRADADGSEKGPVDGLTQAKLANLQAALGDAYREAGELGDAIEAYRKALGRCPGFHDVRQRLALALRDAGLPHQAIREFERVLRALPAYLDARVQLGLTYFSLGRVREAVGHWQGVLGRDPARHDARMYLRLARRGSPSRCAHAPGASRSESESFASGNASVLPFRDEDTS